MQDAVNVLAISKKGKSRIGAKLTTAIVEQNHHDKLFVVWPELNQCRWIRKSNDPDFLIIQKENSAIIESIDDALLSIEGNVEHVMISAHSCKS